LAIAIVILSFVLSTFVSLWSLRLMAKRNMQELSKSLASLIYDSISSELSEPIIVSRSMANDTFLIETLKNEASNGVVETAKTLAGYLTSQKEAFGYEAAFLVSEASKCYYSYGGINKQIDLTRSDRDQWYTRFIETGKEYELDVDRDELSQDQWTVFVDTRIEDADGNLLGVCGVGARMTGSHDLFVTLEKEYKVHISLIDADGLIHVDTDESKIESDYMTDIHVSESKDFVYQKIGAERAVVTKYIDRLGWYLVIESDGSTERGELINVLVLNIVLCAIVLVIMLLSVRIIVARTRALTSASYIDQSTQLLNRRAFEEKKAEMAQAGLKEDFVYITADLNGLKRVNDNLGHTAGDELIKGAADCLKECFGKYGDIYRIGGDEFAAMLRLSDTGLKEAMARLDRTTENWSGQQVKSLSISCGSASSREFPSGNIGELIRISDERMYAAKAAYYARSGIDRRK